MDNLTDKTKEHLYKKSFIVFAGTGVVKESRSCSWIELLKKLEEACIGLIEKRDWENTDEREYPEIAQQFYDALEKENKISCYDEIIEEAVRTKTCLYTSAQNFIVRVADKIVTTNFENSFEYAFEHIKGSAPKIQILPTFPKKEFDDGKCIAYLHGKTKKHLIFRKKDYEFFYPSVSNIQNGNHSLENFIEHLYFNYTLVFVGFSFSDIYFLNLLKYLFDKQKREDETLSTYLGKTYSNTDGVQHYAILQNRMFEEKRILESKQYDNNTIDMKIQTIQQYTEDLERALNRINIKCLWYNEHKEWNQWFWDIEAMRQGKKIASPFDYEK
ncbi:MAG TPA: SIR2 family protein [Anaerohalosphaeraceae bacterium]|nr:SIR2 family protein [Anaerohalosphaeraceae bacterium]